MTRLCLAGTVAFLLGFARSARTTEVWLPPLEAQSLPGTWEGLCIDLQRAGAITFAMRLHVSDAEKGSVTLGFWTGAPDPVFQDTLNINRLNVRKGRVALAARNGQRHHWDALLLDGNGLGSKDRRSGWIRASVRLPGTAYSCQATLFKYPSDERGPAGRETFFSGFGELTKRLGPIPQPAVDGGSSEH
ncbi:MAG TPA: hypothetical protein VN697_00110 [Tepidiformaceae bacterium]|nr:hypothetical protein [Tepidiformaceae bacterium]